MTGDIFTSEDLFDRNLEKAKTLAKAAHVPSILITGKGEPLLRSGVVAYVLKRFKEFPSEIQTNGIWLSENVSTIKTLAQIGLNTIAISIDTLKQLHKFQDIIKEIELANMTCRICLNITDMIDTSLSFEDLFSEVSRHLPEGHQLLIRNIMIPAVIKYDTEEINKVANWIKKHVNPRIYKKLYVDFEHLINKESDLVRLLPHGAAVYHYEGIDVSFSDYCIQESNNTKDIRSLIYDGHIYTSWDKMPGSRLF